MNRKTKLYIGFSLSACAIAQALTCQFAFGMWGCDRFWGVGMRSRLGFGSAIAFGVWGCDRCLGCGSAIAVLRMWGCDRFSDKITTYL
jgi:hypothetical protein